jgi:hypothetical protein
MKRTIELITLLAVILAIGALTGCGDASGMKSRPRQAEVDQQVTYERDLRTTAEERAAKASSKQAYLRGVALMLFLGTVVAFVGGTTLGSKARHDADPS